MSESLVELFRVKVGSIRNDKENYDCFEERERVLVLYSRERICKLAKRRESETDGGR